VNTYLNQAEENTMNKKLISMAVGAALAAGTVVAQAAEESMAPTVYGKVHVSYGAVAATAKPSGGPDEKLYDNMQVREHASRLGVKGAVPITDSLKGTYGLEFGVPGIDGGGPLSNRNQFAGLKGGFGEVRFGRHDTPTKSYQGKFDEFNDTDGDFQQSGSDTAPYFHGVFMGDERLDSTITYLSPNWSGFDFSAQIAPGEGNGCDGTEAGGCDVAFGGQGGNGPADFISLAAKYEIAGFFISGGYNSYDSKSADYESLMRLVATYGTKMFQVGVAYEDVKKNTIGGVDQAEDRSSMGLSGHVTLADVHKIKLQYLMGTEKQEGGDNEATQMTLGYDFKMGKATTAYAMYNMFEAKDKLTDDKYESSFVGIGMIQNF
jgi:predicted porin